mmetsp:Transcript_54642/g.122213  ORF Transcript_54642/g.122213 Transcript_54642/m.122213 type:complete len:298 (+) Transcript_54642:80-973(+)
MSNNPKSSRRREPHGGPSGSHGAVLKKHSHECHHGQSSVCDLSGQLGLLDLGILELNGVDVDDEVLANPEKTIALVVTGSTLGVLAPEVALVVADEKSDLKPAFKRHLCNRRNAVRHLAKLDSLLRGQVARPPKVLGNDIAHARKHTNPSMLQFDGPSPLECVHIAIGREAKRVPKADGSLHTKFAFECPEGGVGVERPVTPRLASQAVLKEHANDSHHSQPSICELGSKLFVLRLRVRDLDETIGNAQEARILEVARSARGIINVLEELNASCKRHHLCPARQGNLGERSEARRNI